MISAVIAVLELNMVSFPENRMLRNFIIIACFLLTIHYCCGRIKVVLKCIKKAGLRGGLHHEI